MHFKFAYFRTVADIGHEDIVIGVVRYIIKHLFYDSQVLSKFTDNIRLRLVFSIQNLTTACDVIFMVSK